MGPLRLAPLLLALVSSTVDEFAEAEKEFPRLRREYAHADLLERYRKLAESVPDAVLRGRAAERVAALALEAELLERLAPLDQLRSRPPEAVASDLAALGLEPGEEMALAAFAFLHDLAGAGEAALGRARDADDGLAAQTDLILAEARGEPVPRGGYHRYRGRFLRLEERDEAAAIDDALERLHALGLPGLKWPFAPARESSSAGEYRARLGPSFLRGAASAVRARLAASSAEVRAFLPSYAAQASLRKNLLDKLDAMAEPRRAALELIARYDKPDQPAVDAHRSRVEHLYAAEYRALRATDLRPLERTPPEAASRLLERIRAGEEALASVDRCLAATGERGLDPVEIAPSVGAEVSPRHLLPGREWSDLEDVLLLVLEFRAERFLSVVARAEDLLRRAGEMTPWERMIARDFRDDAIERLNDARIATSLDAEERRFVAVLNAYRRALGLRPFEIDERLVVASRKHSAEMVDLGYFGHVSPVERNRTPGDRARLEGFSSGGVGENCLAGRADGASAFEAWYRSPGHHRNLVSGGFEVGVGATQDHAMWTMVAGGPDLAWRALHRDVAPDRAARLSAEARALAEALAKGAPAPHASSLEPDALPFLARLAFEAASDPRSPVRAAHPELLRLVAEIDAPPPWRPLRIAAVSAAIEALAADGPRETRAGLVPLVVRHAGTALDYDPGASPARRRSSAEAIRKVWQDEASLVAFGGSKPKAPRSTALVGRAGDAASAEARQRVLSPRERRDLARRFGGGAETEAAVERGLAFLASVQDADGGFRARSFPATSAAWRTLKGEPGIGNAEWEIAMTGLSVLAFVTAGNTNVQGPFAKNVERGAQFLMERIVDYGRFETTSSHYMYSHAIAAQALCELFAVTHERQVGVCAQLAVDYLVFAQHGPTGGWRYEANEHADTSVTGWVVLALNAAAKAGLDASGFAGAMRFLDSVTEPAYYRVGYQSPSDGAIERNRLGAVALASRILIGVRKNDPRVLLAAARLRNDLPRPEAGDCYFWYYATLGLFQVGGDAWKEWNAALVSTLLSTQSADRASPLYGSWPTDGEYGWIGGRIFQTAMSVLMLTTYYRYDRAPKPRVTAFTGDVEAKAEPYLETIRSETDPMARAIASRKLLDRFGSALAPLLVRKLSARDETDPALRERYALLLSECAAPETEAAVLDLLGDPLSAPFAETLVRTLEAIASKASIPALAARLDDGSAIVRGTAARALGKIGDPSAAPALSRRLETEGDGGVKEAIGAALRRLGSRESLAAVLGDALSATAPGWLRTRDALDVLETGGLAKFLLAERAADPALYARCVSAIRAGEEASAVPVLLLLMESRDLEARREASKLLRALTMKYLPFEPEGKDDARAAALERWRAWWKENAAHYRAGSGPRGE